MERMYVLEFIQYKSMTTSFIVPGHVRNAWCSISQITIALLKEEDWNWNVNKVANPLKVVWNMIDFIGHFGGTGVSQ